MSNRWVVRRRAGRPLWIEALEDRLVPTLYGNQLFPSDNPWNQKITSAPVAANSATLVASIGAGRSFHADFGTIYAGALNGIPFNVVPATQPRVDVIIDAYADESDLVPIPIPANAYIEGDPLPSSQNTSDRHLIVFDKDNNVVYETFNTHRPSETADGQWHADSEAVWTMNVDMFRTPGFTSADAAGLPILPGLVRPDEVLDQGKITHALRFTVPSTDNAYIYPASHVAGSNDPSLPRMGERFRLKASFDISGFSPANQVILQALKDYGMIVADNGSSWYVSGEPSPRWDDSDLHNLGMLTGSDFEAVDLTPIVGGLSQNTGAADTQIIINGLNFSGGAGQTQVWFGNLQGSSVTVLSDTQIAVTVPSGTVGTSVDVTVVSGYGRSATGTADHFTFGTPANLQLAAAALEVSESAGSISITVTRTGNMTGTVTVQFATSDQSAHAGVDYAATSGTLTFNPNETSKTIAVPVLDDNAIGEGNETFAVTLSNPLNGAVLGTPSSATVTVTEDPSPGVAGTLLAFGADAGGGPEVRAVRALGESTVFDFYAYDPRFHGGVRVAVGDVTGDHVPDIVTAPGRGGGPDVRVWDGNTGAMVREFMAYSPAFTGGVNVAVGDVNGDGFADIVTAADAGGGPHVEVFSGKDGTLLMSFMAYDPRFLGGVRLAVGDVNGDGKADIITAPGAGGGPDIRIFNGATGALMREFMAYDPRFTAGVYVAAADVNGDGRADVITGAGAGGGPHVEAFSGADGSVLASFFAFDPGFLGGVRVGGVADVNGNGKAEILVAAGPDGGPHVELFDGGTHAMLDSFFAYDQRFTGGLFVGGH
jgi:hypothetical protein